MAAASTFLIIDSATGLTNNAKYTVPACGNLSAGGLLCLGKAV